MNVRLNYRGSGQTYTERFSKFKAKVSLSESGRVNVSFREKAEKEFGAPYAAFSLPHKKARQLADAINAVSWGDAEPVEFSIDE